MHRQNKKKQYAAHNPHTICIQFSHNPHTERTQNAHTQTKQYAAHQ